MNKTILITGSTEGIGKAAALGLAGMGARVLLHGKKEEKGKGYRTAAEISKKTGNTPSGILLYDLASQKDLLEMARQIETEHPDLNVVIHNAGMFAQKRELTADGIEKTFAVNHMAPFILTALLLELLKKNAPSRVVTVSSFTHEEAALDFENLPGEKRYTPYSAYKTSKLCNILFAYALARRLEGTGVTSNAFHPGIVNTALFRGAGPRAFIRFMRDGFRSAGRAAETAIYLAASAEVENVSGKYFIDKKLVRSSDLTYDTRIQEELWERSEALFTLKRAALLSP